MFYELFGLLLEQASEALSTAVRPHVADERARTQLDAAAALLADLAAMWSRLFSALEAEAEILEAEMRGEQLPVESAPDPLARYRAAIAELNDRIRTLDAGGPEEQAVERLRTALLAAAEIQGALVQEAARRRAPSGMRRI
jgi:hypothetical protein